MGIEALPFVGEAIGGICNLGASLVDGVIGPDGVFAQTLRAVTNGPDVSVGGLDSTEAKAQLQAELLRLEEMIAQRRGMLQAQTGQLRVSQQLGSIAQLIGPLPLTPQSERFKEIREDSDHSGTPAP